MGVEIFQTVVDSRACPRENGEKRRTELIDFSPRLFIQGGAGGG